jgi:hypothetical protein
MSAFEREVAILKQLIEDRYVYVTYEKCSHSGYEAQVCGCDPMPTVWMMDLDENFNRVHGVWDSEVVLKADQ